MLDAQIDLFAETDVEPVRFVDIDEQTEPDLLSYDLILLAFSGGKDSWASLLALIEAGVPRDRIELMHHCVDGREDDEHFMDWPVTEDYCRKAAQAMGIPIYFSWKVKGFEGEMLRQDERTKPTRYETPDGVFEAGGKGGKRSTRRMFPQLAASLSTRYCSAYLKVDVASKAMTGQSRFHNKRILFVTGERAQESAARSQYKTFERHRTDARNGRLKRHVDHYRPVHGFSEEEVWEIIERHKVRVHPAYYLGWGRLSCMACIFGSARQWASIKYIDPKRFERIAKYEEEFGKTIHRKKSVREQVEGVEPYDTITDELVQKAMSQEFTDSIFMDNWVLPAGAYGESNGPT